MAKQVTEGEKLPEIVALCGSTRFKDKYFLEVMTRLTLEGKVVIPPEVFGRAYKRGIDFSDSIFVINPDGYIGERTRKEIEYAQSKGKNIYYLEQ